MPLGSPYVFFGKVLIVPHFWMGSLNLFLAQFSECFLDVDISPLLDFYSIGSLFVTGSIHLLCRNPWRSPICVRVLVPLAAPRWSVYLMFSLCSTDSGLPLRSLTREFTLMNGMRVLFLKRLAIKVFQRICCLGCRFTFHKSSLRLSSRAGAR